MAESETDTLNVETIWETANEIVAIDERRREAFEREFEAFEDGDETGFEGTRSLLQEQRARITSLEEMLQRERTNVEQLDEHTAHLRTEQAIRHREQTLSKLREHNRLLVEFCEEMGAATAVIESNIDEIEDGTDTDLADPQDHLARSRELIETHNECIEGLDTNLRILTTYVQ